MNPHQMENIENVPLSDSNNIKVAECDGNGVIQGSSKDNNDICRIVKDAVNNLKKGGKNSQIITDPERSKYTVELKLADAPFKLYPADIVVIDETNGHQADAIHCMNCDNLFEELDFVGHICDYDENKVSLKENEEAIRSHVSEEPVELPCIRQLRENNARIRKFLRDELKIDLTPTTTSKKDGPHECTICERQFVHASGLSRHMEKHALDIIPAPTNSNTSSLQVVTKCLLCGRILFSAEESFKHLAEDHEIVQHHTVYENETVEQEGYEDLLPENIATTTEYLAALAESHKEDERNVIPHIKVVILSSILQCEFCEYSFSEVSNLLTHAASHDPLCGFACTSCEISVQTSKDIMLHWQIECPYVKDQIRSNVNLQKYLVCNVCENKFNSHEHLWDHRYSSYHLFPRLNKDSGKMLVGCEYCGVFHESAQSILKHHEENHVKKSKKDTTTRYRQYLCDVCGKSYTQSSHLWQHLRFHRGVKPFACNEPECNRRFTIRPDLNDHIRKCHTGERPYHCLVCGKRFLTGSVFYQHRLIHRGERRYGCEECGKRFYRADALKNHQRIHTGEKPYNCMYCNKNFRQRGDRDKHIKARHANWDANARRLAANSKEGIKNAAEVVYVGNIAFPTSMFKPMIRDIDEKE